MPNYFTELQNGPSGPSYEVKDKEAQNSILTLSNTVQDLSTALGNKVDKVEGKGLSTNDYSDTEKGKVADNTAAIEAMINATGAKNVLPFDLNRIKKHCTKGTWNGNTYSYNGIDYTVNEYNTITANGTATDLSYIYLLHNQTLCDGGDYRLNGNISGTQADHTAYFYIFDNTTQSMIGFLYGSEDMEFSYVDGHSLTAGLEIPQGKTINNFTFKPMIRDARITDPTYVPYAMTNRELTERVTSKSVTVTAGNNETWWQLLARLYASVDWSKVTPNSYLYEVLSGTGYRSIYRIQYYAPSEGTGVNYINAGVSNEGSTIWRFSMYPSYIYDKSVGSVRTDMSNQSAGGSTLVLVY